MGSRHGHTDKPPVSTQAPRYSPSKYDVPLDEVLFYIPGRQMFAPLTALQPEVLRRLRDLNGTIYEPMFASAEQSDWLKSQHHVIGVTAGEKAWAFACHMLDDREIANFDMDGRPMVVTYCLMTHSAIVYSREVNGRIRKFGHSFGIYDCNTILFDHETSSLWRQISGEAVVGPLTGKQLSPYPCTLTTWEVWHKQHPQTLVLQPDDYDKRAKTLDSLINPNAITASANAGSFIAPISQQAQNQRLQSGREVVFVQADGVTRVYPLDRKASFAINDKLGNRPITILYDASIDTAGIFDSTLDNKVLEFAITTDGFKDSLTDSTWHVIGQAKTGSMSGTSLTRVPAVRSFWFAIASMSPNAPEWIYKEEAE